MLRATVPVHAPTLSENTALIFASALHIRFRLDSTRGEDGDKEDRQGGGGQEAKSDRVDAAGARPACGGGVGGERVVGR